MHLEDQLREELKTAMRTGDTRRRETIRMALAALKNERVALNRPLSEEEALAVLRREVKQRRESIEEYRKGGRDDLIAQTEEELRILEAYLPPELSREQIEARAREIIAQVGATSLQDIGKVMRPLMAELKGQADGRVVNEVVRSILSQAQ